MSFIFEQDQRAAVSVFGTPRAGGLETGLVEGFIAQREATLAADRAVSRTANLRDAYAPLVEALNAELDPNRPALPLPEERRRAVGARFVNPYQPELAVGMDGRSKAFLAPPELESEIWKAIEARRERDPAFLSDGPKSREELHRQVQQSVRDKLERAAEAGERATTLGTIGGFAGGVTAAVQDPPIALSAAFGAPRAAGVLRTALVEAGIGAGSEALIQPLVARYREELGLDYTAEDFLRNVGFAAAGGAVLGGAIRGAGPAARKVRDVAQRVGRLGRRELVRQFDRTIKNPTAEQRAARRTVEADAELDETQPFEGARAETEHLNRSARAEEAARDLDPGRLDETPPPAPAPGALAEPDNLDGLIWSFDTQELVTDAPRFQFKPGGDEFGVTDRLAGVTEWDPVKAGQVVVWEAEDGTRFIVDGHQRVALARKLVAEGRESRVRIFGQLLREADGVTADEARMIAAVKNIAEGTGTAVDAAKVLKVNPARLEQLPTRSGLVRTAADLVRLDDVAFGMVVNEIVPANYAAIVGRLVEDPGLQRGILDLLAKADPGNATQAEAMVRQALAAGQRTEVQDSLFGEELVTQSLFKERATVLDRAIKKLKRDRSVFRTLDENAAAIEGAGNRLARDVNQTRSQIDAQAIEIIQRLANATGPISDALGAAARRAADDGRFGPAVDDFVGAIRDAVERGDLEGALVRGSGRDLEAAAEGGTGAPGATGDLLTPAAREAELETYDRPAGDGQARQAAALERELQGALGDAEAEAGPPGVRAAVQAIRSETAAAEIAPAVGLEQLERVAQSVEEAISSLGFSGSGIPILRNLRAVAGGEASTSRASARPSAGVQPTPASQTTTLAPPSGFRSIRMTSMPSHLGVNTEILVGAINPSSERLVAHRLNDLDQLFQEARRSEPALNQYIGEIAENVEGAVAQPARVKTRERATEKLQDRAPAELSDMLGARIVVEDWVALEGVLREIEGSAKVLEIDDFLEAPRGGYRAIHVQVMNERGFSAEIQIQPREIREAQGEAHRIYAKWRGREDLTVEELAEQEAELARGEAIFGEAWDRFRQRVGDRSELEDLTVPLAVREDPDGNRIVETASLREILDENRADDEFVEALEICNTVRNTGGAT